MINPLRKRTSDGALYTRDARLAAKLVELDALSRDELVERCKILRRDDPLYVPSECLLYFVRSLRQDNSEAYFERLYKLLVGRLLRGLPKPDTSDGSTTSATKERIRDKVFGRFVELLASDRAAYSEKLDYFELRFDGALASLRRDAQEQAWRDENRQTALEFDEETGEPSIEVEKAVGSFDPFVNADFADLDYRSRLDAAIDGLPLEQIRIITMIRAEIPIDSKDPAAVTIARELKRSEKTIRLQRDKAIATLRRILSGEDE